MKKNYLFYKTNVDISNPKSMWIFLHDHFTYWTMNSWNRLKTIAHNIKLYNLNLDGDWQFVYNYLYENNNNYYSWPSDIQDLIDEFEHDHPGYRIRTNGSSGGYLLLVNEADNQNVLPNFITDYDHYEDLKDDYTMWSIKHELREYTKLVRDFDKLCEDIRDVCNFISLMDQDIYLMENVENAIQDFSTWAAEELNALNCSIKVTKGTNEDAHKVLIDICDINKFYALQDALRYYIKKYCSTDDYDIEEYLYGIWKVVKK